MRTFGKIIAVQTAGPDAIEDLQAVLPEARDRLARYSIKQMEMLRALGYALDVDTFDVWERQDAEQYLLGYVIQGRQTIPLWRRLWKAAWTR